MTYSAVIKAAVILAMVVATIVLRNWPRHPDGRLMTPEEANRWLEYRAMREPPRRELVTVISVAMVALAALACALSNTLPPG